MESSTNNSLVKDVGTALKNYRNVRSLRNAAARNWPAVTAVTTSDVEVVRSIRRILDQALAAYHEMDPAGARLLREHYVQGQSIRLLAIDQSSDQSTLYRQQQDGIQELAVIIEEFNRVARRRQRMAKFHRHQPIVGVEQIVTRLVHQLYAPDSAILVLEGMGGLGKTTLAYLIAERCAGDEVFADVLWTSAKQTRFDVWSGSQVTTQSEPLNASDLIYQIAHQLNIEIPANLPALRDEVRAHCAQRSYLIVFDNLETVADMAALAPLIDMLVGTSRILITTRDHTLEALPAHLHRRYEAVRELDAPTSYQLLRQAAAHIQADGLVSAADAELAQIYEVIGGNPLALLLVVGQARGLPWRVFLDDLVTRCPARSKPYELYDYLYRRSWNQLSSAAQQVLFAMHRCEGGASFDLLFKLSMLDDDVFRRELDELQQHMLLSFDGRDRYTIHRLTYTFLRVVIAGGWRSDMNFHGWAQAQGRIMHQHLLQDPTRLALEDDVARAVDLIRDYVLFLKLPESAISIALAFHSTVERWSAWPTWAGALDIALQAAEHHGARRDLIQLLNCRSQAARELGDDELARQTAARALELAEAAQEPMLMATSHNKLGVIAFNHDELEAAQAHLAQAYRLGSAYLLPLELGHICLNMGLVATEQGHYNEGRRSFDQAVQHYQRVNDVIHIAKVHCNLVELERRAGVLQRMPQILLAARDTFRSAGARYEYGLAENGIGYVYLGIRQYNRAEKAFQRSLSMFEQLHTLSAHALVLSNLTELYVTAKRWEQAATAIEQARQAAIKCDRPLLQADVAVDEGRMRAAHGDISGARALWQAALAVQEARGATFAAQKTQRLLDQFPPD